jgi:hypothetical protein
MSPVCLQQGPLARVHQHGPRHRLFSMRSVRERLEGARRHAGRNQPVAGGCPTAAGDAAVAARPCVTELTDRVTLPLLRSPSDIHPLGRPRQRRRRAVKSLRPPQCGRRSSTGSAPADRRHRRMRSVLTATVSFSRMLCTTLVTSAVAADGRFTAGCRDAAGGATEDAGAVRCWWSCCCRPWSSAR